jgi:hypothetical protein
MCCGMCCSSNPENAFVLRHVSTRQVIHDPEQKLLILVMEFMPGGPILSNSRMPGLATEPLPEPAARSYFR